MSASSAEITPVDAVITAKSLIFDGDSDWEKMKNSVKSDTQKIHSNNQAEATAKKRQRLIRLSAKLVNRPEQYII